MLRYLVEGALKAIGALVLFLLLIVPAAFLDSAGYETPGLVVGWIAVGVFLLSIFSIVLEPLVRAFRKER